MVEPQQEDKILLSWDDTERLELEQVKFFVDHYIPSEGIVLLYGKYGTYKTPLTVTLAKAIATGRDFLGLEANKASPILYVELDTPKQVILPRLKAIGLKDVPADFAFCYPGFDVVNPNSSPWNSEVYAVLSKAHRDKHYRVVFVDALRGIHNLPSEAGETVQRVYKNLALLFPGAVILLIHHDRKTKFEPGIDADSKDEISSESFSGSQAWINHATVAIKVSHHNKKKHQISLTHVKSQASALQPPLIIQTRDGSMFASASSITPDSLKVVLGSMPEDTPAGEKDSAIAEYFGVSERTARRARTAYESFLLTGSYVIE